MVVALALFCVSRLVTEKVRVVDYWDDDLRQTIQALIPQIEGMPCVNTGDNDGQVYVCRRISNLNTDEDSFIGQCEWVDPPDARPDELTDGMAISCDCVRLGPGWWQDTYFGWYFVYDPLLVAQSLGGDHSWVPGFLESVQPKQVPLAPDLRPAHTLRPPEVRPYLSTIEVVSLLRREFGFFAAQPLGISDDVRASILRLRLQNASPDLIDAAAGRDCAFSVVAADNGETTNYLNFEVRPGEGIIIRYRDQQHETAARPLVERCARLLGYEFAAECGRD